MVLMVKIDWKKKRFVSKILMLMFLKNEKSNRVWKKDKRKVQKKKYQLLNWIKITEVYLKRCMKYIGNI